VGLSLRIRDAGAADLGEVITLQRAAFLAEAHIYGHPRLPPMQETVEEARQVLADPSVQVLVAEVDRPRPRIVGCVRARPGGTITDVGRLATAPDLLGRGIGSRLLQHVHDFPSPITEEFELFTGDGSTGNHRLYAAHGYLPLRRFVDSEGIEVIVMRRPVL
jgi:GNAT superfamily N-acetyltransferase